MALRLRPCDAVIPLDLAIDAMGGRGAIATPDALRHSIFWHARQAASSARTQLPA